MRSAFETEPEAARGPSHTRRLYVGPDPDGGLGWRASSCCSLEARAGTARACDSVVAGDVGFALDGGLPFTL
jgi:hypothetical protein